MTAIVSIHAVFVIEPGAGPLMPGAPAVVYSLSPMPLASGGLIGRRTRKSRRDG
ncbi:MAG: hypothetical protein KIT18_00830 [Burkholderiales bacterium]|nr:hypothetical protein [Burkholderiales bacterium]